MSVGNVYPSGHQQVIYSVGQLICGCNKNENGKKYSEQKQLLLGMFINAHWLCIPLRCCMGHLFNRRASV
jgi:hypothetical protein